MLSVDVEKLYPAAKTLVKARAASRIHAKDATLYDFSPEAQACASDYMGWVDLATSPLCDMDAIQAFADEVVEAGLDTILLIGQGGSTQAPMTITKYNKHDSTRVKFRTLDSDSPVRVREMLTICDPHRTLVIISSKSGGTIEPRMLLEAVRASFEKELGEHVVKHLVAITDPGSDLDRQARKEGWRAVFSGEPTVGGRFSALSVFGLVPAALTGIDMEAFMAHAREAEEACSEDAIDNPAINLAAFLYDNYLKGRNKFSFLTPKRGRVLGLWIEQLVAESLGKNGEGILPNIEIDSLLLTEDPGDRSIIMYQTQTDLWDERRNFEMSLAYIDPAIPRLNYRIDTVEELAEHFVMWEYAIAMCEKCAAEYADPLDRRFHAQPDACFECGPSVTWRVGADGPISLGKTREESDAIFAAAVEMLMAGKILAVKGLGGFHLVCDANNADAVAELRRRKRRDGKALAVMAQGMGDVRALCEASEEEEAVLAGSTRPIVLLRKPLARLSAQAWPMDCPNWGSCCLTHRCNICSCTISLKRGMRRIRRWTKRATNRDAWCRCL